MCRAASLSFLALAASLLLAPGCGGDSTHELTDVRDREKPRVVVAPETSTAERFGYRIPGKGHGGGDPHAGVPGMGGGMRAPAAKAFKWETPEGWEEAKGSKSRDGTWRVKGEPQTDCSLSKLRGTGGGIVMNVNRWRDQMGAAPLEAAAVAALPRKPMLGAEAVYVDIPGTYGGGKLPDARMLGYLLELPTAAVFLKFVGPAKVVEANQGAFEQLAASIQIAAHGGGHGDPAAGPPREGPESSGRPSFAWSLPESWQEVKGRAGRVVTVAPKTAKQTQCYLYLLAGDGGGLNLNINRWRGQMGQKDLSAAEIGALERIDVLGTKAVLVSVKGPFSGQSGEKIDGAQLYGLVILKEDYLLTAKMNGPASEMAAEWGNFVAFCKSIKRK